MATIKPIEGRSVHQIQSGQVIVDLQSVCKELVENSLDAGATSIEVRFKNNGLDSIEVQDNGSGIAPEDFETIALKHYTSKLSTYDDLSALTTFGFRGEALSSLCALSKFHIVTTRAADGPKGTKLEFEQSGKLKGTSVVAAKPGTTIVVETLFHNLPVRRKELEKTVKREYNKVLALLHAYACISTGVKFSVSNQVPKGKKTIAFATNSNPNTKENIANVYGTRTLIALVPLSLTLELDPSNRPGATQSARNWSTEEDGSRTVKVAGHISRPVVGEGRQTPDRQMLFVNSRPCLLPQVAKAFNEVYKSFNVMQSPFIFANIKLDTNAYDVNVSPDKRTILLHDQTALLESLKEALANLFEGHDQSVPKAQLLAKKMTNIPAFKPPTMQQRESTDLSLEHRNASNKNVDVLDELPPRIERSPSLPKSDDVPYRGFIKASLIESFAGRDAEERVIHQPARRRRSPSPGKERAADEGVHSSVQDAPMEMEDVPRPPPREPESPIFEPEWANSSKQPHVDQPSKVVQDFNARIASQHARQMAQELSPEPPDPTQGQKEESIRAIKQTPQKALSQSSIQNAFDRMRPARTPVQQATITVGDTTTVSTIGSESRLTKRARVHTPKFSLSGSPLSQTPKKPLFMKSLRGFAAPGTQMADSDDEGGRGGEDGEDSSMADIPTRSPSRHKRPPPREFEKPSVEDLHESSSAPPPPPLDEDLEEPAFIPEGEDGSDEEYIDETEKKAREEAKIAKMIADAEEAAARPTELNLKRAEKLFQVSRKKYTTINLERVIETDVGAIARQIQTLASSLQVSTVDTDVTEQDAPTSTQLNKEDPEERLSLTVTKSDFDNMRIIGQFNLGFILAVRPPTSTSPSPELFIIDQHASDEKYNFERFTATTVLVSQRLVHPHPLELTAVEEELILANEPALTANGFTIALDTTSALPTGRRAKLTSLPMSKEVTFTPTDLEELLALLLDDPSSSSSLATSTHIPRPSKVRKLLASRACRSSVMVGKTLKSGQMEAIVRHMGSMDKPWSCPHGRPTMRHLFGLERWEGWAEGSGINGLGEVGGKTDWGAYLGRRGA
ncbi:DNA mismatch repair protein-like protein pms1 [Massariosphaeria phaeospora]|uniref:DNA mismatch repair protein PMS1 n=1 Tax=Massariosphaeria phaeospora TaxID=100035 RepID=A0A7C8I4S7_9PLEO|nr:DNA mismatch repair protein-like protein pms1 [Massariosphaeria phaeospora]